MPELFQLADFLFNNTVLLIFRDNLLRVRAVFLTENVNQLFRFIRLKNKIALQSAAGVSAVVEVVFQALLDADGICIAPVRARENVAVAAVSRNLRARKSEEALDVSVLKLVLLLEEVVAFKIGMRDKKRVLKINLILLVVILVYKLAVACSGEVSRLYVIVGDFASPNLIIGVLRNIIGRFRGDFFVLGRNDCVSCTVAALALVLGKRLADGRPRAAPIVAVVVVLDVNVASGLVAVYAVKAVAQNSALCAALNERISARVARDNRAVFG